MSSKRRKFTPEFRAEAVRLVAETDRPVAHVAAEIGVGAQSAGSVGAAVEAGPCGRGSGLGR